MPSKKSVAPVKGSNAKPASKDGVKRASRPHRQEKRATSVGPIVEETTVKQKTSAATTRSPSSKGSASPHGARKVPRRPSPPAAVTPSKSKATHAANSSSSSPSSKRRGTSPAAPSSPSTRPTRDHAYAGPTFSNSPAASRLPMPDFLLGSSSSSLMPSNHCHTSPASSTTSLTQPTTSEVHDKEVLRARSRELLDLLRGHATTDNEPATTSSSMTFSSPAAMNNSAHPFSADHCAPLPQTRFYERLSAAESMAPHWPSQHSSAMPLPPPPPITALPPPFVPPPPPMHVFQSPPSVQPMMAMFEPAINKATLNDMYSHTLRAMLRLDIQA
jgi:hypothetical protein